MAAQQYSAFSSSPSMPLPAGLIRHAAQGSECAVRHLGMQQASYASTFALVSEIVAASYCHKHTITFATHHYIECLGQ